MVEILCLMVSQSVMSILSLNRQIIKFHFLVRYGLLLCRYVQFATSERSGPESSNFQSVMYGTLTVISNQPPLNKWVNNFVLHSSIKVGSSYCHVNIKPLNSGLQVWDPLVGYVQSTTSEPIGAQIQFISVLYGLAANVIRNLWQRIRSLVCLSLSYSVYHLWIDGSLKSDSPPFCHHIQIITSEWQNFDQSYLVCHFQLANSRLHFSSLVGTIM